MAVNKTVYDVIVVGAGIEGLATARYLAKQGRKVLTLEQFAWPHNRGSSWGLTRITRLSYYDPRYGALMRDAYNAWFQLEAETGMQLYRQTGMLLLGKTDSKRMADYEKAIKINGFNCDLLNRNQLLTRYPHLSIPQNHYGIFDPSGGLLFAAKSLNAFMDSFKQHGGTFIDDSPMHDVVTDNNGNVKVVTKKESYAAKSVVLALGPWAPEFLRKRFNISIPVEPQKTITCYWKTQNPDQYSSDNGCPLMMGTVPTGPVRTYFMKPSMEFPGLIQMGVHFAWAANPDRRDETEMADKYLELCRHFADTFLPGVDSSKPVLMDNCMYTENLHDKGFILDRLPGHSQIIIATGFSGHGFKLAPVVGKILGDMAINANPTYPLEYFRLNRFPRSRL